MHELGIADAMLKTVKRLLASEEMNGASSVSVEVGELSGVIPHYLSDCWEAVCAETDLAQTALRVKSVPGTARCEDCKSEFTISLEDLRCPRCQSDKLTPLTGRDVTITEIEAY